MLITGVEQFRPEGYREPRNEPYIYLRYIEYVHQNLV